MPKARILIIRVPGHKLHPGASSGNRYRKAKINNRTGLATGLARLWMAKSRRSVAGCHGQQQAEGSSQKEDWAGSAWLRPIPHWAAAVGDHKYVNNISVFGRQLNITITSSLENRSNATHDCAPTRVIGHKSDRSHVVL